MRLQQRNSQKPNSLNPMMTTYTRRCMKIRKWRVMKTERRYPQFSHQWMDNGGSVLSKSLKRMAPQVGLEPTTLRLTVAATLLTSIAMARYLVEKTGCQFHNCKR